MACRQVSTYNGVSGSGRQGGGGYVTEADCLQACKEGACCESNGTCNVRPQCQCQGAGKTFKGNGTSCTPNPCSCLGCCSPFPDEVQVTISSSSADVCFLCSLGNFAGGISTALNCVRTGTFSASGTYTLTYMGNCTYRHTSCSGGKYVDIQVAARLTSSGCVWVLETLNVVISNGVNTTITSDCRDCAGVQTFTAAAAFLSADFVKSGGFSCGGTATLSTSSAQPVGFDPAMCNSSYRCGLPYDSPDGPNRCFSGSNESAANCTPSTISATVTLTL